MKLGFFQRRRDQVTDYERRSSHGLTATPLQFLTPIYFFHREAGVLRPSTICAESELWEGGSLAKVGLSIHGSNTGIQLPRSGALSQWGDRSIINQLPVLTKEGLAAFSSPH